MYIAVQLEVESAKIALLTANWASLAKKMRALASNKRNLNIHVLWHVQSANKVHIRKYVGREWPHWIRRLKLHRGAKFEKNPSQDSNPGPCGTWSTVLSHAPEHRCSWPSVYYHFIRDRNFAICAKNDHFQTPLEPSPEVRSGRTNIHLKADFKRFPSI